jgi:3-deoxy-D-manno-octulosonic-acid transferase
MPRAFHKNDSGIPFPRHVRFIMAIYCGAWWLITPILILIFRILGKKDPAWLEFIGQHTMARPAGTVIWIHGASLGELRSALPLMRHLKAYNPDVHLLITGCNSPAIRTISPHVPKGSFVFLWPLDSPLFVKRFLDHWKPNAVCFLECELWPCLLENLNKNQIPFFNINFFTDAKSLGHYSMLGSFFPSLLSRSSGIWMSCADKVYRSGVQNGWIRPQLMPSLKYGFTPFSKQQCSVLPDVSQRLFWLVSCTTTAEESLILNTHKQLQKSHPDLLLIWALRNPASPAFLRLLHHSGQRYSFRSKHPEINKTCTLYLVDTLGELDLFYSQAPFVIMGNSFTKKGAGHNILEPIAQGCLPIVGPFMPVSQHLVDDFLPVGAIVQIPAVDLASVVNRFLNDPNSARLMAHNGMAKLAEKKGESQDFLDQLMPEICPPWPGRIP